jgi:hypothetical protein
LFGLFLAFVGHFPWLLLLFSRLHSTFPTVFSILTILLSFYPFCFHFALFAFFSRPFCFRFTLTAFVCFRLLSFALVSPFVLSFRPFQAQVQSLPLGFLAAVRTTLVGAAGNAEVTESDVIISNVTAAAAGGMLLIAHTTFLDEARKICEHSVNI